LRHDIAYVSIAPSIIMTPPSQSLPEDYKRRSRAARLIKRDGQPEDIAAMAAFLGCDASGYITGQAFPVDGGYLVHHPMYEGGLALLLADEGSPGRVRTGGGFRLRRLGGPPDPDDRP
jgi:hypothetical protein